MYDLPSMRQRQVERLLRIVAAGPGAHADALYQAEKAQRECGFDGLVGEIERAIGEGAQKARAELKWFAKYPAQEVA